MTDNSITKPDRDKRKLQTSISHELRNKCPQQNICKPNPATYKKNYTSRVYKPYAYKVGFIPNMQGWVSVWKSINEIHHINKLMTKRCHFNWYRKVLDRHQHPFMIKIQNIRNRRKLPWFVKECLPKNVQLTSYVMMKYWIHSPDFRDNKRISALITFI